MLTIKDIEYIIISSSTVFIVRWSDVKFSLPHSIVDMNNIKMMFFSFASVLGS